MTDYTPATEMHCWFMIDEDGEEGIPAIYKDGVAVPLVSTDRVRMDQIAVIAQGIANKYGARVEHVVFSERSHVEWLEPE